MGCFISIFCSKCKDLWLIHLSLFVSGKATANSWTKSWWGVTRRWAMSIPVCALRAWMWETHSSVTYYWPSFLIPGLKKCASHLQKREGSEMPKWAVCSLHCQIMHIWTFVPMQKYLTKFERIQLQAEWPILIPTICKPSKSCMIHSVWYLSLQNQKYQGLLWISLILSMTFLGNTHQHTINSNAAKSSNPSCEAMTWQPDVDLKSERILDEFYCWKFPYLELGNKISCVGWHFLLCILMWNLDREARFPLLWLCIQLNKSGKACGRVSVGMNTSSIGIGSFVPNGFAKQKISNPVVMSIEHCWHIWSS